MIRDELRALWHDAFSSTEHNYVRWTAQMILGLMLVGVMILIYGLGRCFR